MKKVILQKGKEKSLLRYHPWVFSGAVAKMDRDIANGDIVEVCDRDGNFLAMGHYHDNSIAVRIFSFEQMTPRMPCATARPSACSTTRAPTCFVS